MKIHIAGREYEVLFGSDIINDGVYLELNELLGEGANQLLLAFKAEKSGKVTVSCFREELPLEVLQAFLREVESRLLS